jgi:hypothetical protein
MRRAEFMSESEEELEQLNAAFRNDLRSWLDQREASTELPAIEIDMLLAILVGPSQDYARRWLSGRATTSLREATDVLTTAALLSLRGLREAQDGRDSDELA